MLALRIPIHRAVINILHLIAIFILLTSCQYGQLPTATSNETSPVRQSQLPEVPKAEITFEAQALAPFDENQNLYLEILDEVTGLALNAARVMMEKQDPQTFVLKMPVAVGSVIKYRYVRDQDTFGYEYTSLGSQVRYRLYFVNGPGIVNDTISGWKMEPLSNGTGRIQGHVAIEGSNAPVINALVTAGGMHTLTASDGSFMLEGLPAGLHNLVIYSLDGAFETFQQGAVVAPQSATPATVFVKQSKMVNVTFLVTPPADGLPGLPIHMAGNLFPLGNMFADLAGGTSTLASRTPMLAVLPDGRYSISMKLPIGMDLRYKYTLGDGFWNTERTSSGELRLRQIIVPEKDTEIEDVIDTWKTKDRGAISFTLTTPANTPATDFISIQFNPYGWTSPIPMWPAGNGRWFYILYNPLGSFNQASFRFCRNDQCGTADDVNTRGFSAAGIPFTTETGEQNYDEVVDSWAWLDAPPETVVVPAVQIQPHDTNFQVGVEFMPGYHPSWQPLYNITFQNLTDIGSNTVVLTPTWRFTHQAPPVIEPVPGRDALWNDMTQTVIQAQKRGLGVVIHPVLRYPGDPAAWWMNAVRDDSWWQSWFDRYRTYILYHADLAAQTGAKSLILGDETLFPALPGGVLPDGSPSGVPGNASERWQALIADVRARYTGKIVWFVSYNQQPSPIPEFAASLDQVYVQISGPLFNNDQAAPAELEASIASILDSQILPLQEKTGQPVVIGLKYPSVAGAMDGCVLSGDACLTSSTFDGPAPEASGIQAGFNEQANAYTALLSVINQRSWISGFYSVGYYPPVLLRDLSISVRGKPAGDVLWYWYPRMTGKITQ